MSSARQLLPGRVLWLVFFATILVMTGIAAVIASIFAAHYKPHTELHWQMAYVLVWLLLVIYAWTFRSGRYLFSAQVWFFWLLLVLAIVGLHLDDVAPAPMLMGDTLAERPAAPALYVAAALDTAAAVILSAHVLVLRRLVRRIDRRIKAQRDELAAEEESTPG